MKILSSLILFLSLALPRQILAVCPVCTVLVGAGVGLSRWLGIDDLISGVWVGGLIVSMIFWTLKWLEKKNIRFKFIKPAVAILFYAITILPLYWSGIMGHEFNKFLGIDKLLFGIIVGSLVFVLAVALDKYLRNKKQGKAYFPFQRVALPVLALAVSSLIFYLICRNLKI